MKPLPSSFRLRFGFAAALLVLAASSASAQPSPPRGRVLLFPEANFRGDPLVLQTGDEVDDLEHVRNGGGRKWNDRIVSVRIEGPVLLVMFEDAGFRGAQATLTRDAADLGAMSLGDRRGATWARRISSLRVVGVVPTGGIFIRWERRDAERAIRSAYRDLLGRDPDDRGVREYLDRLIERGWTEDQLRDAIRSSAEYRNRDVSGIIRRVYREALGRDPDPSGSASYTRALHNGMSESEMRAELMRSRERAELDAKALVTRAYRDLLRRDPDPAGLANYIRLIVDRGWDDRRVRDALRQSEEYRKLPRR